MASETPAATGNRLRLIVGLGMFTSTATLGTLVWLQQGNANALIALYVLALTHVAPAAVLFTRRPRLITWVQLITGVLASVCLGLYLHGSGGTANPAFNCALAFPFALSLLCRETPLVSLCSGSIIGLSGAYILRHEGRGPADLVVFIGMGVVAGLIGGYGSYLFRKLQEAELDAERERRFALEELAMLQRQHAESERLATVGRLAAGVAHEINNPLAFVSANVSFVSKAAAEHQFAKSTPELDEVLAETEEGLRRIHRIVADLTDLARPASQAQESCDPAASIETAVRIASVRAKGIAAIQVETTPLEAPLAMNGARLVQVLVNLLLNSIDAIESGPPRETPGTVWVQLAPGKLVIADDGPGISSEAQERLFEPFFTTKPRGKGTGLGLALCRQYLAERGFSITADGRPGGGARFIVNF